MQEGQRHYSTPTERWFHRSSPELNHRCDLLTYTSVLENKHITIRNPFWDIFGKKIFHIMNKQFLFILFYLLSRTNYPHPLTQSHAYYQRHKT